MLLAGRLGWLAARDVFAAEDGAAWTQFLRGLIARGLAGVKLVGPARGRRRTKRAGCY